LPKACNLIDTADGQEIVAVIDEPYQTRFNEDGSFIGLYSTRHSERLQMKIRQAQ
jgi:hypothetical protein